MFGRMPEGAHRRQYRRAGIGTNWNQNSDSSGCRCLKTWWPGTESNRRRQPFQGLLPNRPSGLKSADVTDGKEVVSDTV